ncbi:proteasome component M29 [Lithohypha guttulata]|uniref:proteasome component M29 n=1 Tax=Lithohypha guttulata TaxID=1690604 RepID=UPI002DE089A5|nr:proteasome component M29 [Lithohypha guttulata]
MASASDFARERRLIEQLEFRIAAADSNDKLQNILQKFLSPLLLKLATEDAQNRNLTIKVCQYIKQRLQIDQSIQLPVEALPKVFQQSSNAFVKQFSLLFIQQGLDRLSPQDGISALPSVIQSAIRLSSQDQSSKKMFTVAIDFLLDVLVSWRPPEHASPDDQALKSKFDLDSEQATILSEQLSYYLLFDPKVGQQPFITEELLPVFTKQYARRSSIVPNLANFIFMSIFTDAQRFVPAIILSVDANAAANARADVMFKQCDFDLEDDSFVDPALNLYNIVRPKLQTRILTLLSRSKASTSRIERILGIIQSQLGEPATNLEASKLRAAMFSYLIWSVRMNPEMGRIAKELRESLKQFIEMQGWPAPSNLSASDTDLRAKAFESIGLLCGLEDKLSQVDGTDPMTAEPRIMFDLVSWLFTSLRCDTSKDVRHSIEESLSRLMTAVTIDSEGERAKLKSLLLWNATAQEGDEDPIYHVATRTLVQYPAVRFANKVLPFSDVDARVIDLIALTSTRREVVEEGHRGLDPSWHTTSLRISHIAREPIASMPSFESFAKTLFGDGVVSIKSNASLSHPSAVAGAVQFSRNLIASQAWHNSSFSVDDESDWQRKIDATLDNESEARSAFRHALQEIPKILLVQLLRLCYKGMALGSIDSGQAAFQLSSLASNEILQQLSTDALLELETASNTAPQNRYWACRIAGMILSLSSSWEESVGSSLTACISWQSAVGQEQTRVETALLKAACILSRRALRQPTSNLDNVLSGIWGLCRGTMASTNKGLRHTSCTVVGQIALCVAPIRLDAVMEMIDKLLGAAKKENDEAAVSALGRLASFVWRNLSSDEKSKLLEKLYDLHEVRKAEFHFALGEALAVAALRFQSSSTLTEFDIDAEIPGANNSDLFKRLLSDILERSKTTKPALKKATGIWLLSLVEFCTTKDLLTPYMREIQVAFSRLLSDRDEIVQETGSRGLGIVYERGDRALRDDLVRDLVQSFTGNSARTGGTVTEETQLFEPGALPTENGQSVSTYKDIVSLAQEMGDPSLVYRFMNLASNNAIWTSRAAFGRFGLSGVLANSDYLRENKKFYPKLFRYRFDPNPNVQRSMDDIWKALVKDSNATIDEYFDIIIEDLLQSIVYGREWRAREASCAAISDLVQGRDVEKFERYLDDIWKVAFKVLDDVKESVRVAAMKLCRTLTNMLLRNLEVEGGTTKRATTMLKHAMPFLIDQLEAGAGKEVQQYAIVTLLDIVKKAPPRSLQNYAPIILETFVNSLSSLEHESINYLHLNADKYGLTADKLDSMRVSSIGASPVTEAIEKCLDSLTAVSQDSDDPDAMQGVERSSTPLETAMKKLENSFKVTIGLPSRVGLSRVMVTLVVRYHAAFRQFADRFVRLTRKSILDRNATISQSFSTALAYLLRLASEKEVRQTIEHIQKLYFESQDVSHRAVAGEVVQATSKASNDLFMRFATSFLPFTFIGRQDLDDDVRERFDAAWTDNVGGSRTLLLYLKEIVEMASQHIKSSLWPIHHACCFAVANFVSSVEPSQVFSKEDAARLWPVVEEALGGKTWEGKEKVVLAFPKFVEQARTIWPDVGTQMRKVALREAKRNNILYRPHALEALAGFTRLRQDINMSGEVIPFLVDVVENVLDKEADLMEVDQVESRGNHTRDNLVEETLRSAVACVFAVIRLDSTPVILEQALNLVKRIHAQGSNTTKVPLYEAATRFIQDVVEKNENDTLGKNAEPGSVDTGKKFLYELTLAFFRLDSANQLSSSNAEASEAVRLARTNLALKIVSQRTISRETREVYAELLTSWDEHERSRPIRQIIETASTTNRTAK